MDAVSTSSTWSSLSWESTLPFGKELPDYSGSVQNETSASYSSLSSDTLMTNILGVWHLNETTTGTAPGGKDFADDSGNSLHGTKVGSMTLGKEGRLSKAVNFSGGGISLGNSASLNFTTDFSVAFWFKSQDQGGGRIFSSGFWGNSSGVLIETYNRSLWFKIGCNGGANSSCLSIGTTNIFADGAWHHGVALWDKTNNKARIYVDGKLQPIAKESGYCGTISSDELSTTACAATLNATRTELNVYISTVDGSQAPYRGLIDEVAVWKRVISATEVKELYRRGANRLLFQVRSCAATSCAGEAWRGPDGTNQTFFSELNNNTSALNGTGTVKTTSAALSFSDFASLGVTAKRYFQYRYIMESDDSNSLCNYGTAANCSPELKTVGVGGAHYPTTNPSIVYSVAIPFYTIGGFTETVNCPAGTKYQLSLNNSSWYYHNGTTWAVSDGTLAKSSSASAINSNAATFDNVVGRSTLYVKALLPSSGSQACEVDNIAISGNSAY